MHESAPGPYRQGRRFPGSLDHQGRNACGDLALAKPPEGFQIDAARFLKWSGQIGYVTRQPGRCTCRQGHAACSIWEKPPPISGKHKAAMAPHACLDLKAHLVQLATNWLQGNVALVVADTRLPLWPARPNLF